MASSPRPEHAVRLFEQMMRDIMAGPYSDPVEQVGQLAGEPALAVIPIFFPME